MSTEVAKASTSSTALGALKSLRAGLQNVQQTIVNKTANPFLRLGRDGIWIYGPESIEVEEGSLWAANPFSIEHGWTAWDRSKDADNSSGPLGEIMVAMSAPLPPKDSLHDVGADWSYQMAVSFVCLNGTDKGEQVLYKANSVGGVDALEGLIKAIGLHLDEDENTPVPVVSFGSDSYQHKKYGKTYTPELTIVQWAPMSETAPEVEEPEEQAKAAEPAKATRTRRSVPATKPKEEPAPADADEGGDEDAELTKLMEQVAAKKAAKDAAAKQDTVAVDPRAAAKAKLLAELAALEGDAEPAKEDKPADTGAAPLRRRRS
jgi:hypothetical protein